jgi:AAA domain
MIEQIKTSIKAELELIWAAHHAVGLKGFMCLYSDVEQNPWRSKQHVQFWFNEHNISQAIDCFIEHYNSGNLPNSPLLLNPIVHKCEGDKYIPLGSGIAWATALALGIARVTPDKIERPSGKGVLCNYTSRGEDESVGLKMLLIASEALQMNDDGRTTQGCQELYNLVDIKSDVYAPYYMLAGVEYLSLHGTFQQSPFEQMLPLHLRSGNVAPAQIVSEMQQPIRLILEATQCFIAYDKIHTLYNKFGQEPANIAHNNKFFNLCARDLDLFDRTGPMREGSDETFQFVVEGLVPRGAITLLAATGGTGKSSIAHMLCVLAAIDYRDDEERPLWLGQKLRDEVCHGICVYFSGEDGPAIVNARNKVFDPEGRAKRLQFHRTEFADKDISFGEYLERLQKMPDVSMVVIDPARKYLSGDENDSEVVSEFFEAIEEFAIRKNCGMIVAHHLQKGANPKSAKEVLNELRGSQVFIDRPRVVIGMCRDDKHTIVGLAKCNIPAHLGMITEERLFTRDPKTLQLIWLPGEAGVRRDYLTKEELEKIEFEQFQAEMAAAGNKT